MNQNIMSENLIQNSFSLKDVVKRLQKVKIKTLIVLNKKYFLGTITDGDLRRAILNDIQLSAKAEDIANKKSIFTKETDYSEKLEKIFKKKKIDILPIINSKRLYIGYHVLEKKLKNELCDFVIMAGGFGKRLMPLTKKIPKPLIKIKSKPMIEYIIQKAQKEKFKNIKIITHYKSEQIEHFVKNKFSSVKVYKEIYPMGTIGGIKKLNLNMNSSNNTLITNCDIFTSSSYNSILNFHKSSKADMTVVTEMKKIQSPFGNIKLNKKKVTKFEEKPEHINNVVIGIYIFKNSVLKYLKNYRKLDLPNFINLLIKKNKKIVPYPIVEKWVDIGNKSNLREAIKYFGKSR